MKTYLANAALFAQCASISTSNQALASYRRWQELFSTVSGLAPVAAQLRLEHTTQQWRDTLDNMNAVAEILQRSCLEALEEQLREIPEQQRREAEEVLDFLCAREIEAACAGTVVPPEVTFAELEGLSFGAIHRLNYRQAPPHVREMADANPDVTLLEVGPGTTVAMVYPGGPAGMDTLEQASTAPASVTTLVPGVFSSKPSNLNTQIEHARSLGAGTKSPTIAWIGYSAPSTLLGAAHAEPAQEGGKNLHAFQLGIDKRWPTSQKVVVGHSYGSVVTGNGNLGGAGVDELVLVGSPGTSKPDSAALGVSTWYALYKNDHIILARGTFGTDPASKLFGAKELPFMHDKAGGHSDYFTDPGFLRGLSSITNHAPGGGT